VITNLRFDRIENHFGIENQSPQYFLRHLDIANTQAQAGANAYLLSINCNPMELETTRLRLRKFTLDDAPFILRLVNEPSWLQYIGDRHVHSIEDAERYLLTGAMRSYADNGFGSGMVTVKETGEEIGMCGLFKRDYLEEVDLGFALLPEYTGKGYAVEIAEATLRYAKEVLGFPRVAAFTAKDNHASMKLLTRIGFKPAGNITLEGEELNLFKTD
jgi:RimJ/RimL family protein N-acetyltransferase